MPGATAQQWSHPLAEKAFKLCRKGTNGEMTLPPLARQTLLTAFRKISKKSERADAVYDLLKVCGYLRFDLDQQRPAMQLFAVAGELGGLLGGAKEPAKAAPKKPSSRGR